MWRAYQQYPELVRRWIHEEYPKIEQEARKEGAEIRFGDESGVRSDYHAGATWGRRGKTPAVEAAGARYRLNMLSAVNRRGEMRFMIASRRLNAMVFRRFLHRLMIGSKRKVFLIIDGHPMHKSGIVRRKVESYKGRLRLFLLPPYSPELNPDEGVWREVKSNSLGRAGIFSFGEMKSKTVGALRSLAKNPDKIRTLFNTETTRYAA